LQRHVPPSIFCRETLIFHGIVLFENVFQYFLKLFNIEPSVVSSSISFSSTTSNWIFNSRTLFHRLSQDYLIGKRCILLITLPHTLDGQFLFSTDSSFIIINLYNI
jgi:hypothetical protein